MPSLLRKLIQWFAGRGRAPSTEGARPRPEGKTDRQARKPAEAGDAAPGPAEARDARSERKTASPRPVREEKPRPRPTPKAPEEKTPFAPKPGQTAEGTQTPASGPGEPSQAPPQKGGAAKTRPRKIRGRKKKPAGPPPPSSRKKKKKRPSPAAPAKSGPPAASTPAGKGENRKPSSGLQTGKPGTASPKNRISKTERGGAQSSRPAARKETAGGTGRPEPAAKSQPAKKIWRQKGPQSEKRTGGPVRRIDRHGMPVFDNDADFGDLFVEEAPPPEPGSPEARPPRPKAEGHRPAPPQTNRHGIPVFGKDADLSVYFSEPEADFPTRPAADRGREEKRDEFERWMESALEGLDQTEMLSRKQDELPADRRPSLRRRLRDYPPPQAELDLHGFTSAQAAEKTEAFLRTSRHRGRRTVLIITGRGIHSDGRPVLPDVVESRIADLRRRNWILASQWERGDKKRSGALIVYLRPPAR